jgi:hypothetical protein
LAINGTLARDRLGNVVQSFSPGTTQSFAYTGTAGVTTNAVGSSFVLITCTSKAFVAFGTAPTATTADMYVPADFPMWFPIDPSHKVSVIQHTAGGSAYITAAA